LQNHDLNNGFAVFRKAFVLETVPKRARLSITADQAYRLFINGTYVCSGPARGFQAHWPFDQLDVAAHLGGIRQTAPGWKTIDFDPTVIGDSLECTVPTPLGPIRSSWKRTGENYDVKLQLPKGTTATRAGKSHADL
jgi:hypothetical protein